MLLKVASSFEIAFPLIIETQGKCRVRASRRERSPMVISRLTISKMLVKSCATGVCQFKYGAAVLVHFDEADPSPVRTSSDRSGAEWKTSQSKPTEEFNFILAGLPYPTIVRHYAPWLLTNRRDLTDMKSSPKTPLCGPRTAATIRA